MAQVSRTFDLNTVGIAVAMVLAAVLWEVFEIIKHIPEDRSNGVVDVVLSILGFGIAIWVVPSFSHTVEIYVLWVVIVLWLGLNVGGFLGGGWRSWIKSK